MVVQTRFFSCRFSISHAKQRPTTAPRRAARSSDRFSGAPMVRRLVLGDTKCECGVYNGHAAGDSWPWMDYRRTSIGEGTLMTRLMRMGALMALACLVVLSATETAFAWDRGQVETFAVLPDYAPGVPVSAEGLAVGLDGNIYVPSGGFNADGSVPGPAKLWVFNPEGQLVRTVTLTGTQPPVLGIAFNPANGLAFIADLGDSSVFKWNPASNTTRLVASLGASAGPNAICFDASGNVYISDSFQGIIWKTDKNGKQSHAVAGVQSVAHAGQWSQPALRRQRHRIQQPTHRDVRRQHGQPHDHQGAGKR